MASQFSGKPTGRQKVASDLCLGAYTIFNREVDHAWPNTGNILTAETASVMLRVDAKSHSSWRNWSSNRSPITSTTLESGQDYAYPSLTDTLDTRGLSTTRNLGRLLRSGHEDHGSECI